jgi:general secretion pathway protein N
MTGQAQRLPRAAVRRVGAAQRLCELLIIAAAGVHVSTGDGIAGADTTSSTQARLSPDVELPPLVGNPIAQVPLDRLSATRDRPLFSASRRPTAPPPPPAAPRIEHAAQRSPVQSPSVALFGIVIGAQGPRAFIGTGPTDPIVGVRPGDDVSGWRVTAITQRSLVLSRADLSATFMLFSPENASRVAHFDSAAPSQQAQRTPNDGHPRIRIR